MPANPNASYGDTFAIDDSMLPGDVDHSFALGSGPYVWTYPRPNPQGWKGERDMHSGQQFTRLLELPVAATT